MQIRCCLRQRNLSRSKFTHLYVGQSAKYGCEQGPLKGPTPNPSLLNPFETHSPRLITLESDLLAVLSTINFVDSLGTLQLQKNPMKAFSSLLLNSSRTCVAYRIRTLVSNKANASNRFQLVRCVSKFGPLLLS